jgi:hypothetical protein
MSRNRKRRGMWERKESTWRQAGGRNREGSGRRDRKESTQAGGMKIERRGISK